MDIALHILTRILIILAALGAIGCLCVIPITAVQILAVAFDKDEEHELVASSSRPK